MFLSEETWIIRTLPFPIPREIESPVFEAKATT